MGGKRHDWIAYKLEWLNGSETLNQFRIRKGLQPTPFYARVKGWQAERDGMKERAIKRAIEKTEDALVEHYTEHLEIIETMRKKVAVILQEGRALKLAGGKPTNIKIEVDPADLNALAGAMEKLLKSERLIRGHGTGEESGKVENFHLTLVKMVKMSEKGELPPIE